MMETSRRLAHSFILAWLLVNMLFVPFAYAYAPETGAEISTLIGNQVNGAGGFGKVTAVGSAPLAPYLIKETAPLKTALSTGMESAESFLMLAYVFLLASITWYLTQARKASNAPAAEGLIFAGIIAIIVGFSSERVSAETCNFPSCSIECTINPSFYNATTGNMTIEMWATIPGDPIRMYRHNEMGALTASTPPGPVVTNIFPDLAEPVSLEPGDPGFRDAFCYYEGDYYLNFTAFNASNVSDQFFSCADYSHTIPDYNKEGYCVLLGCGGKYTDSSVYSPTPAGDKCCGDDRNDDPDGAMEWCVDRSRFNSGCTIMEDYIAYQDPGKRDWKATGTNRCCGDDIAGDSTSDCLSFISGSACVSLGGKIEPDRVQTVLVDPEWEFSNDVGSLTGFLGETNHGVEINFCTESSPIGTILYDAFNGVMTMRKRCVLEEGTNGWDGIQANETHITKVTGVYKSSPYFVKEGNWAWVSSNQTTEGNIYYSSCAGYSILSLGDTSFASCTNDPVHQDEKMFAIDGLTFQNTLANPFSGLQQPGGRANVLCHEEANYPGTYRIVECCGTRNCETCMPDIDAPHAECLSTPQVSDRYDHKFGSGSFIVEPLSHDPSLSIANEGAIENCTCFAYDDDENLKACMPTGESWPHDSLPACNENLAEPYCRCFHESDCLPKVIDYYCMKDQDGTDVWARESYMDATFTKEAFQMPIDIVSFGACEYTPIFTGLQLGEHGQFHYCDENSEWIPELDDDMEGCAVAGDWTGDNCCGEMDDYPEFYSDSEGSCWRSAYQPLNTTVIDTVAGETHDYRELLVLPDGIHGCAVDDANDGVALKPEDLGRGATSNYSVKLALDKGKIELGGSNGPNIMDRTLFYLFPEFTWATRTTNDWMLHMVETDGEPMVIDDPYCTTHVVGGAYKHCSYNETWEDGDLSHLSYIEWAFTGGRMAGCCNATQCWNGTYCIEGNTSGSVEVYPTGNIPGAKFVCVQGEWEPAITKTTWDRRLSNYTANESNCLVDPLGNPSNNFHPERFSMSTWLSASLNDNPQWIGDGQYIYDHLCMEGEWTSRSKVIASALLDYADEQGIDDFTLFCDNYNLSLNNYLYNLTSSMVTHSQGMPCRELVMSVNEVRLIYLANKSSLPISFPNSQGVLCNTACLDAKGQNIPCVNSFCVLRYYGDGRDQAVFGVSLNQDFLAPDYPFIDVLPDVGTCYVDEDHQFHPCPGDTAWYNPSIESVIYSKADLSLSPGLWQSFLSLLSEWIGKIFAFFQANPVQDQAGFGFGYVGQMRDFNKLYIAQANSKRVEAITEIGIYDSYGASISPRDFIYGEFEGFSQDICSSLEPFIGGNDAWFSECIKNGNSYVLTGFGENYPNTGTRFIRDTNFWIELTAKLRLDQSEGQPSYEACTPGSVIADSEPCMCGPEAFDEGAPTGSFGTPASSVCCSNGPCEGACDPEGKCPSTCGNPLEQSCSCEGTVCAGSNKVVFPWTNEAGYFSDRPMVCMGTFTIDLTSTRNEMECSTGWSQSDSFINPSGGTWYPPAYPMKMADPVECGGEVCYGYNSNITERWDTSGVVNGTAICCDGAWMLDMELGHSYCCFEQYYWDPFSPDYCNPENFYVCDGSETSCGDNITDTGEECDNTSDPSCVDCVLQPCGANSVYEGLKVRPCSCLPGYGDCDLDQANGCETVLSEDGNCGACGTSCSAYEECMDFQDDNYGCYLQWCVFDQAGQISIPPGAGDHGDICTLPCE